MMSRNDHVRVCALFAMWICCLSCAAMHTTVIRHGGNNYILHDIVAQISGVTSPVLCAQACFSRDDCAASMLYGQLCVLYRDSQCPCPLSNTVSLHPDLPSRYQIAYSEDGLSQAAASAVCEEQAMHLVAITSQLEQDSVTQLIRDFSK